MKKKNGYTLVELVTTILILGIVALIAIPVTSTQLKKSRRDTFKVSCEKIFELDEKYEVIEELIGEENECVVFDFDKNLSERQEINGEVYEPISSLGLENTDGLVGQYRICKGKQLLVTNGEFTCVYNLQNSLILDSSKLVTIPVLSSIEVTPYRDQISVATTTTGNIKNYYYKIDDKEYIKTKESSYIFMNLKPETEYTIKVYVEDVNGIKSEVKTSKKTTGLDGYGIDNKDYKPGDEVTYESTDFLVVKDDGDYVTLITKKHVTTGIFGETSSWMNSDAKNYLNTTWLSKKEKLNYDIAAGWVKYADDTNSYYIRMITRDELRPELNDRSETPLPFWTMTAVGNNVYYASSKAAKTYIKHSIITNEVKDVYVGTGYSLDSISRDCTSDSISKTTTDFIASPKKKKVLIRETVEEDENSETVVGKESYTSKYPVTIQEEYECVMEDRECEDYECNKSTTIYSTIYGSYCGSSTCAGSACASNKCATSKCATSACSYSTCASSKCALETCNGHGCEYYTSTGWYCAGHARTSCGKYSCGKGSYQYSSCNTYNKGKSNQDIVCGPAWRTTTDYCTN